MDVFGDMDAAGIVTGLCPLSAGNYGTTKATRSYKKAIT